MQSLYVCQCSFIRLIKAFILVKSKIFGWRSICTLFIYQFERKSKQYIICLVPDVRLPVRSYHVLACCCQVLFFIYFVAPIILNHLIHPIEVYEVITTLWWPEHFLYVGDGGDLISKAVRSFFSGRKESASSPFSTPKTQPRKEKHKCSIILNCCRQKPSYLVMIVRENNTWNSF